MFVFPVNKVRASARRSHGFPRGQRTSASFGSRDDAGSTSPLGGVNANVNTRTRNTTRVLSGVKYQVIRLFTRDKYQVIFIFAC